MTLIILSLQAGDLSLSRERRNAVKSHKATNLELLVGSVTMTKPDLLVNLESLIRNDWEFCMKL